MTSLISKKLHKLLVGYGQASKVVFAARVPGTILSTSLSVNFSVFSAGQICGAHFAGHPRWFPKFMPRGCAEGLSHLSP